MKWGTGDNLPGTLTQVLLLTLVFTIYGAKSVLGFVVLWDPLGLTKKSTRDDGSTVEVLTEFYGNHN